MFWVCVKGANCVHLPFGYNFEHHFDAEEKTGWAGSTCFFPEKSGWAGSTQNQVDEKTKRICSFHPIFSPISVLSRLNPNFMEKNRVQPAQHVLKKGVRTRHSYCQKLFAKQVESNDTKNPKLVGPLRCKMRIQLPRLSKGGQCEEVRRRFLIVDAYPLGSRVKKPWNHNDSPTSV